jgi:hypothetical protein
MGLISKLLEKRMKDPVEGTAQVVSGNMLAGNALSGNYNITCVVSADGVEPQAVIHKGQGTSRKWPQAGMTLPIVIDRANPTRFVIKWGQVETTRQQNTDEVDALNAAMRSAPTGGTAAAGTGLSARSFAASMGPTIMVGGQSIDISADPNLRKQIAEVTVQNAGDPVAASRAVRGLLREKGFDVPAEPGGAATPGGVEERLSQLDKLKADGALDAEEYERQRQRIIESI